ncbi:MAG: hypothetical protein DBY40_02825 [Clostridiales bacterium]|nr:MAG: hypothetical protein DBY40_02825 [Clostridiales bacterium]
MKILSISDAAAQAYITRQKAAKGITSMRYKSSDRNRESGKRTSNQSRQKALKIKKFRKAYGFAERCKEQTF